MPTTPHQLWLRQGRIPGPAPQLRKLMLLLDDPRADRPATSTVATALRIAGRGALRTAGRAAELALGRRLAQVERERAFRVADFGRDGHRPRRMSEREEAGDPAALRFVGIDGE